MLEIFVSIKIQHLQWLSSIVKCPLSNLLDFRTKMLIILAKLWGELGLGNLGSSLAFLMILLASLISPPLWWTMMFSSPTNVHVKVQSSTIPLICNRFWRLYNVLQVYTKSFLFLMVYFPFLILSRYSFDEQGYSLQTTLWLSFKLHTYFFYNM